MKSLVPMITMVIAILILAGCGSRETSAEKRQRQAVDLCYKGYDYLKAKDTKNAEAQFKQALELDPFCEKAKEGLAKIGLSGEENVRTAKTQIGMLQQAVRGYALDLKNFPTTQQGLAALLSKPTDLNNLDNSVSWKGPYIESLPSDPWGNAFRYEYPPTHGSGDRPEIWSAGPDGQDDSEDDIVSWSATPELPAASTGL